MNEQELSIGLAFFWYGFSLVFILFACITHVVKGERDGIPRTAERLVYTITLLVGVWGLATLLGIHNASNNWVNQFMIVGVLVGFLVSNRITGRPQFHLLRRSEKADPTSTKKNGDQ